MLIKLYLIIGKDPKYMKISIGSEAKAVGPGGDDPGYEGPMPKRVIEGVLPSPVCPLPNSSEVRVVACQAGIEHRYLDTLP